jgi:hypothetical protein
VLAALALLLASGFAAAETRRVRHAESGFEMEVGAAARLPRP